MKKLVLIVSVCLLVFTGCDSFKNMNNTQKGALGGAALGAATGALVSDNKGKGALIGGVSGAALGGGAGYLYDKSKK